MEIDFSLKVGCGGCLGVDDMEEVVDEVTCFCLPVIVVDVRGVALPPEMATAPMRTGDGLALSDLFRALVDFAASCGGGAAADDDDNDGNDD